MVRASTHPSSEALRDDLLQHARLFGFESLIFSGVPVRGQKAAPMVELNGWPRDWFDRYIEHDYAAVDGVCLFSAQTIRPFDWADVPPNLTDTPECHRVIGEASEFGIRSGYAV